MNTEMNDDDEAATNAAATNAAANTDNISSAAKPIAVKNAATKKQAAKKGASKKGASKKSAAKKSTAKSKAKSGAAAKKRGAAPTVGKMAVRRQAKLEVERAQYHLKIEANESRLLLGTASDGRALTPEQIKTTEDILERQRRHLADLDAHHDAAAAVVGLDGDPRA